MNFKLLLWGGLATVFLGLAVRSYQHRSRFRHALEDLEFKGIETTKEYREFCDALDKKSETGLQTRLLADMIPLEIVGFLAATIAAALELV